MGKEKTTPRLITLFQGVELLAIGEEFLVPEGTTLVLKKEKGASAAPQTVTFALTPQEASLLSFVQEHGKIKLALRSQEDTKPEPVAPADWDTLFKYLSSGAAGAPGSEGQPVVEIYRGLQKELVPLSEKKK
jgi:Flp pilus assembly protein CpaB